MAGMEKLGNMREIGSSLSTSELQSATHDYYAEYEARKGADRNSLLNNPEVLFQSLARDAAMVRALRWIKPDPQSTRVLDVGCGDGDSVWILLRLGFQPANLFGVDIQEDKILRAKATNPLVKFEFADATSLAFDDNTFDMAMESMMFLQLTEDDIARRIADLYQVGTRTEVCRAFRGALVPPVGRFLSKYFSSAYFAVHALFPFLA